MPPLEWASPSPPRNDTTIDIMESPKNFVRSDIDSLLGNPNLDPATLLVYEKIPQQHEIVISSESGNNIIVRKNSKQGSRHFRGESKSKYLFKDDFFDLTDVPISSIGDINALRARKPLDCFK